MINIEKIPNQITPAGLIDACKVELTILSGILGQPMNFYYRIIGEKKEIINKIEESQDITITEGNLSMSQEDYDNWDSSDDEYAINWCIKKLNLNRIYE